MNRDGVAWVEVSVEALARAFGTAFREHIIPDDERFSFWVRHVDSIERTNFVEAIVVALEEHIKQGEFDRIDESFDICEFVLSHPDDDLTRGPSRDGRFGGTAHWHNARRAVGKFLETCVSPETNVPLEAADRLFGLVRTICLQTDWRLDGGATTALNWSDPYMEAINTTRGTALETMVRVALWLRNHDPEADISGIIDLLERRLSSDAVPPLVIPEYSVLGKSFGRLLYLDSDWATRHIDYVFPQYDTDVWVTSFSSYLLFAGWHIETFEALREQFVYAIEHLSLLQGDNVVRNRSADRLADALLVYYLWGVYGLEGDDSLLAYFYKQTNGLSAPQAELFGQAGRFVLNSNGLTDEMKARFVDFFEWRLAAGKREELGDFWFWLEADCLDADWRLDAFLRVLDLGRPPEMGLYSELKILRDLLPDHCGKVVACLAKITDSIGDRAHEVRVEPAREIIRVGLDSGELDVMADAKRARENLLKRGVSGVLDAGA